VVCEFVKGRAGGEMRRFLSFVLQLLDLGPELTLNEWGNSNGYGRDVAKFCILWETVHMGNKDAPKREKKKPAKKK
jgi:hypothetical protein